MAAIPVPAVLGPAQVESGTATPDGAELVFADGQAAEYRISSAAELEFLLSALATSENGAVVTVKLDDQVVATWDVAPEDGGALDAGLDVSLG